MSIAISGASGRLGLHVMNQLLKRVPAQEIVMIVRDVQAATAIAPAGVEIRQVDYSSIISMHTALTGIEKLILIASSEIGTLAEAHFNVIAAAQNAGIRHFAYTSLLHTDQSQIALAKEHFLTEQAILKSGLNYTILRNGWYTENYTNNLKAAVAHSVLIGAAGEGKISSALLGEYAEAVAIILTTPTHENKIYELAGDQAFTMAELAAEVSRQTGKNIVYLNLTEHDYREKLINQGTEPALANLLVNADMGATQGALFDDSGTLQHLLGRPTTTLQEAVRLALA
ncbi:SDR family oxidoreductase [Alkanindiges sp. WGS2144]|uniref:SDR family oxidoreductase n=1 Tax=Alkanindiges sp. WGS2144 TaxID=3366808 RepID=UPI003752BC69